VTSSPRGRALFTHRAGVPEASLIVSKPHEGSSLLQAWPQPHIPVLTHTLSCRLIYIHTENIVLRGCTFVQYSTRTPVQGRTVFVCLPSCRPSKIKSLAQNSWLLYGFVASSLWLLTWAGGSHRVSGRVAEDLQRTKRNL
jgi:hypothetical protein